MAQRVDDFIHILPRLEHRARGYTREDWAKSPFNVGHSHFLPDLPLPQPDSLRCWRCKRELPLEKHWFALRTSLDRRGYQVLHPYCYDCRMELWQRTLKHPLYSRQVESYFRNVVRKNRSANDCVWGVDHHDLVELFIKQEGKCARTGLPLTLGRDQVRDARVVRINSGWNFTVNNIEIVAASCIKRGRPRARRFTVRT